MLSKLTDVTWRHQPYPLLVSSIWDRSEGKKIMYYNSYYLHTEKYSPKSYVVNFHTQMSSSHQRSERCFSHVKKKIRPIRIANDVNFTMIRLIRSRRCVSFGTKFPPFIGACSLQRPRFASSSQTFNEKRFSPRAFLFKKVKNISEIGVE